ncbi:hypothetical protein [Caldisphaera sp.]|jgi:hypothetical protein|uniref:hypothetical protein n=1 Tax=Caldisphaera sp. TaxID=2060322 RepID=UPI00397ACE67
MSENQDKWYIQNGGKNNLFEIADTSKNVKLMVFRLLGALKYFYSFKELEERLNVPAQILWRYVTLRTVPERTTAEKILNKIRSTHIIDDILAKYYIENEELWSLLSNPGIMTLAGLRALDDLKDEKINVVVTAPDSYAAALGATFSSLFHAKLCAASHSPYSKHIISKNYKLTSEFFDVLLLPRECVARKSKIIIIMIDGNKTALLSSMLDLAITRQAHVEGIVAVIGSKSKIDELSKSKLKYNTKSIVLINTDDIKETKHKEQNIKMDFK